MIILGTNTTKKKPPMKRFGRVTRIYRHAHKSTIKTHTPSSGRGGHIGPRFRDCRLARIALQDAWPMVSRASPAHNGAMCIILLSAFPPLFLRPSQCAAKRGRQQRRAFARCAGGSDDRTSRRLRTNGTRDVRGLISFSPLEIGRCDNGSLSPSVCLCRIERCSVDARF
jgi:hypothetical protein